MEIATIISLKLGANVKYNIKFKSNYLINQIKGN